MTYNTNVPVASQTPSLFPAQGTANFTVLKQTIGRDHIFNNTVVPGDNTGYHKQVTLQNRNNPSSLPTGLNAMLYSQKAAPNASQLMFWDGTIFNQLTPLGVAVPLGIGGTTTVANGATNIIFADPGYKYTALVWAVVQGTNDYLLANIIKSGANAASNLAESSSGAIYGISIAGGNLGIQNTNGSSLIFNYSAIIMKSLP